MSTSEQPTDCFNCNKHRGVIKVAGGAIYEDDLVYAGHIFNEKGPTYLGYLMAELKRHAPGLAEQTDEEAQALGLLVARLSRALKASEGAEHIYTFVIGHHVPHLHIHVAPRYPGAPREYWGIHVDEWPNAPRGGAEEIEALCERLRSYLKRTG
ncbi:MAG TPA: HIT family protein [Ktedonosporobacter sp.]|nr:HIT family protein [Ktedonosporobacter sp.]